MISEFLVNLRVIVLIVLAIEGIWLGEHAPKAIAVGWEFRDLGIVMALEIVRDFVYDGHWIPPLW